MSSNWNSIGSEQARQHPLYGIKGWLLVFLVGNFIGLLWMWAPVNTMAMDHKISIGQLLSIDAPEIGFLKAALYMEISLAVATIFLIFTKYQYFRLITITGRLAFWPILGVVALSLGFSETGRSFGESFFPWVVSCAVWVTYLQRSKRVRVTFEHCVRNEEHQTAPEAASSLSTYTNQTSSTMLSSTQPLVIPTNDRPTTRQQNEFHPVEGAVGKAGPPAQNTNATVIPPTMKTESSTEEDHWATAMAEIESGQRRPGVWAKAFAESDGDETKAKVAYLKSRVKQLADAAEALVLQVAAEKKQAEAKAQATELDMQEAFGGIVGLYEAVRLFVANEALSDDQLKFIVHEGNKAQVSKLCNSITGNYLLHACAERGMLLEVDALLKAGADSQQSNNEGQRPEHMAKNWATRLLITGTSISVEQLKGAVEVGVDQDGDIFISGNHTFRDLQEAIDHAIAAANKPRPAGTENRPIHGEMESENFDSMWILVVVAIIIVLGSFPLMAYMK